MFPKQFYYGTLLVLEKKMDPWISQMSVLGIKCGETRLYYLMAKETVHGTLSRVVYSIWLCWYE